MIPLAYDVEEMPGGSFIYYFLDSSFFFNLFFNYVALVLYTSLPYQTSLRTAFFGMHILYHTTQLVLMYFFFHVRKQKEYFTRWNVEQRWVLFPTHTAILLICLNQNPYMGSIASSLFLNLYWTNHLEVLHLMNRDLENQTD